MNEKSKRENKIKVMNDLSLFQTNEVILGSSYLPEDTNRISFFKRLLKSRLSRYSFYCLLFMIGIAVLSDFIANDKPIVAGRDHQVFFPVFASWLTGGNRMSSSNFSQFDWKIMPLIPYLPHAIDYNNAHCVGPFDKQNITSIYRRHWFGTDELGHDVLSVMIHGTRISLFIGVFSMVIASFLGIILGTIAGYFGDDRFKMSRIGLIVTIFILPVGFFYSVQNRFYNLSDAFSESVFSFLKELTISFIVFGIISVIAYYLVVILRRVKFLKKQIAIPLDMLISRGIDVFLSLPLFFIILSVMAIMRPSVLLVALIIGFSSWAIIARLIRAELLRIRSVEYIEAAAALGLNSVRIILKHTIPNALSPVFVAIAFGIAGAIMLEAAFSFLGIGLPADRLTWGSLLSAGRVHTSAWWLSVLPGTALFSAVAVFNFIGDSLSDKRR